MNTAVKVIIAVVVVVVVAGGGYLAFHKNDSGTSKKTSTSNTTTNTGATTSSTPSETTNPSASVAATITFTDNGFSPAVTTVKAGDTVKVTNNSSQELDFDSDPHPTHTDESELNVGPIGAGESKTFTVTKTGHWGFHDHLNPSMTGTLDVE